MKNHVKIALLGLLTLSLFAACEKEKNNEKRANTPQEAFTETAFEMELEMVYVEGGRFQMGATAEQGDDVVDDEKPVRTVRLDSYYIGKHEVTQAQWISVMGTTLAQQKDKANFEKPLVGEGDNYPMYYVSWNDAQKFCEMLSEKTGKKYVLPTEAQWEYAARGGKKSKGYKYAGGNTISEVAWYYENSKEKTHEVGTKKANELGIYDMSGNVWEWCSDWYGSYDRAGTDNPTGPKNGTSRVKRGGSWYFDVSGCRVSERSCGYSVWQNDFFGFRVAMIP
ncbi:MAG: formylglycine-generating enzyme family protein [Bacteroides sp.]|nr:formylglycine-generating enzyme family protein [Ruminococcus flavefaciens]MCM1554563.1 formylglycine-generating enzyme family protein [Bacteroides sp.]